MITPDRPIAKWQDELRRAIRNPRELLDRLDIDPSLWPLPVDADAGFPLRVPLSYVRRMRRADPDDPLLRQVMPHADEVRQIPGFGRDPVGEQRLLDGSGLIRKYRGRALLLTTASCGVHCRYCFRREFPYGDEAPAASAAARALQAIADDPSLDEVILSGGDPLSLSDRRLDDLLQALQAIDHVRRIRIHTRQPVVLPSRVDAGLIEVLGRLTRPLVIVLHVNHANEIDEELRAALRRLRDTGAQLLNQSVLLRGVNDRADALARLSRTLHDAGVMPYYLHLLDRVTGAAHFEVDEDRAMALAKELHAQLPGYLVPRLVREQAGMPGKTWLPLT